MATGFCYRSKSGCVVCANGLCQSIPWEKHLLLKSHLGTKILYKSPFCWWVSLCFKGLFLKSKSVGTAEGVWLRMYLLETSRALNLSPTWARMAWGTSVLQLCSTKTNMSHSVLCSYVSFHIGENNSIYLGNFVKAGSPVPPYQIQY